MAEDTSTLDAECDAYAGRMLIVEPHYGYGWTHQTGSPLPAGAVPDPFQARVVRVYSYQGERRGIVARVTQPGFAYDGYWLVSMTRHIGTWNFTDRPAHYNLLLCPEEPSQGPDADASQPGGQWPAWDLRGQPVASGFGRIAESLQYCVDDDARHTAASGPFWTIGKIHLRGKDS